MQPNDGMDLRELRQRTDTIRERMQDAQAQLATAEMVGSSGNGMVTVTLSASGEPLAVRISEQARRPENADRLESLVLAAMLEATSAAADGARALMAPISLLFEGLR